MTTGGRPSICYVVPGWDLVPGSALARHALSLARALSARADVNLVFRRVLGPVDQEPFDLGAIEPDTAALDGSGISTRALGRFVEQRCASFGVVFEGSWLHSGKLTAWCARRGIPAAPVIEAMPAGRWLGPLEAGRDWLSLGASGRYLRQAAVIIAGSEDLRAAIVERWRVAPGRIVVIGPGVDRTQLAPQDQAEARRRLGLGPEHRVLLAGGALDRRHDLTPVLEAVQRAGDPALRLHVLGHGERRAGLERLAGSDAAVTFHGRVPDELISTYIGAADLCLAIDEPGVPVEDSLADSAFTVRECLAAGRPVAIGSGGDLRHPLIRHLVSGFLVPHDVLGWVRFLQRDCPSRNTLRIMGQAAAATPLDGMDRVADGYLEASERVRRATRARSAAS